MHDAVAGWNDIDIFKSEPRPINEMKAIFVSAIFDGAVLFEGLWIIATAFHG